MKRMTPSSGRRSPASCPMSVVLPAPLGPMIAWVSPETTSRSIRSLACRPPKRLLSARTSRTGLVTAGARQEAEQTALREQHDQDQGRPEDDLPVSGQCRQD